MSKWNYRVMEFASPDGEASLAIHEVHYDASGSPQSYSTRPAAVIGERLPAGDRGSLGWTLDRMRVALAKPILTERDFE